MLEKIFLQILNMSFTASFVIVAVIVARLLLKKAPRVISYALWAVVLFRLVCPFSFESAISLLPVNANPIPQEIVYQQTPQINTGIPILNDRVNAVLPAPTLGDSMNPLQGWVAIGTFLWLCGIAALMIYSAISLLILKRKLRGAICEDGNVYLTEGLASPFVMGLFRPQIHLPTNLTDDEKGYILLHEQTHIKRLDHVVKIVSFAVLCLHWFNPLVWIAFFLCSKDMEMSCDEAVIKRLGSEVKKDYSSSLLALATGRRIVGGSPLAFGEGDTKSRIKNVLNYKKPAFWVVVVAVLAVVVVGVGLMANPQQKPYGFAGVNAIILEIDKENQSMLVKGIDQNSAIGGQCVVDLREASLITVATNSEPKNLSLDDFSIGDTVVLFIGEIQESYPTMAAATTVQLQPKEITSKTYSTKDLWNARTQYVGNNVAVGNLIGLLPFPDGLTYDHFELHTDKAPYGVEIVYSVSDETLQTYDVDGMQTANPFRKNALLMLALIDNADQIRATLTNGTRKVGFVNGREWAEYTVGEDVRIYAQSAEKLQKLIDFPITGEELPVSFEQAMSLVSAVYPPPLIVEADGDRTIIKDELGYTFNISTLMAKGDSITKEPQLMHIVGVIKSNGQLWEYGMDTGKWVKANPMTPDTFLSAGSQSFQIKEGMACFIIPNEMPSGYDVSQLSVHVSGTMPMGGDGSNMSLHAYETEAEAHNWQLGEEYTEKMVGADVPDGTEIEAVFSLPARDGSASDHSRTVTKRFPLNEDDFLKAVTSSYYAGQSSRAFKMLQKSVFQNWVEYDNSGALNASLVTPKWKFDSFTQYYILDQNMKSTSDQELYYCTFSDENNKHGYIVVSYNGDSLSKIDRVETPYPYDLQANIDDITAKIGETKLDLSTAVAMRVRIADAGQNTTREAIRITDSNANQYLYYFDESGE